MASAAQILAWKSEGRAEGFAEGLAAGLLDARRDDLMKLLRVKFHQLPPELTAAVRGAADLAALSRWFDAALAAPTLEGFARLAHG